VPDLASSIAQQFASSAPITPPAPSTPSSDTPTEGPSLQATPQLDEWTAKPDPLPQPPQIKPGKLAIPLGSFGEVIFPLQASNFAIVKSGLGGDTDYQVADLRNAKPIGKPLENVDLNAPLVFSATGRYVAGRRDSNIEVWSFSEGQKVAEFEVKFGFNDRVFFAGPHELGTLENPTWHEYQIRLFDIRAKTLLRTIQMKGIGDEQLNLARGESFAVSPGGKYAALLFDKKLHNGPRPPLSRTTQPYLVRRAGGRMDAR
jgi:hypothetical protein